MDSKTPASGLPYKVAGQEEADHHEGLSVGAQHNFGDCHIAQHRHTCCLVQQYVLGLAVKADHLHVSPAL